MKYEYTILTDELCPGGTVVNKTRGHQRSPSRYIYIYIYIYTCKIRYASTKFDPKVDQNWSKNQPKAVPRPSWGALGAILGPRWLKTTPRAPKPISLDPLGRRSWKSTSTKNRSRSDVKCDHFLSDFLHNLLKRFGANLAPKNFQKWSQVCFNSHPKGNQAKS